MQPANIRCCLQARSAASIRVRSSFFARRKEGMLFDFSANGDRPTDNDPTGLMPSCCLILKERTAFEIGGKFKLACIFLQTGRSNRYSTRRCIRDMIISNSCICDGRTQSLLPSRRASPVIEYMLQFGNGNLDINQWVTYRLSIDTFFE